MDDLKEAKQYHMDMPQKTEGFFLKGSNSLDWGMKNRLARIFNPESGRTVMLAIDHGYFQGPTTGLERVDLNIVPLIPHADTLMLTRGMLRSVVPPSLDTPVTGGVKRPIIRRFKSLSQRRGLISWNQHVQAGSSDSRTDVFIRRFGLSCDSFCPL